MNSLSAQGQLPLSLALIEQQTGIANTLVTGGADVNAKNSHGDTLLIEAVKRSDAFSANYLLDNGCDVNLTSTGSADTALHHVCTYSRDNADPFSSGVFEEMFEVGQKILTKQADVNKQNTQGYSPLILAVSSGNVEMVDELLKNHETDLNLVTNDGKSALQIALLSSKYSDFAVAKKLIDNGAETNDVHDDATGDNLLQFLIKSEAAEAATLFLCDHVNLSYKNRQGYTSLHLAAQKGLAKLVTKLLMCGASPNTQSGVEEGKTALVYAIEQNSVEVVKAFVDYKAIAGIDDEKPDFNCLCSSGDPLSIAMGLRHNDLVPLLIKGAFSVCGKVIFNYFWFF